jgi:hypothetical protein
MPDTRRRRLLPAISTTDGATTAFPLVRGHYAESLRKWTSTGWSRSQILVVGFSELTRSSDALERVRSFAGLAPYGLDRLPAENTAGGSRQHPNPVQHQMCCATRRQLSSHFDEPNQQLYAQLAEDLQTGAAPPEERPFERFLTKDCDPCVEANELASAQAALASSKEEVERLNEALRAAVAQVRTSRQAVRDLGGSKPQRSSPRHSVAFIVQCTSDCTPDATVLERELNLTTHAVDYEMLGARSVQFRVFLNRKSSLEVVEQLEQWIDATTGGEDMLSDKLGDLTVESVTPSTRCGCRRRSRASRKSSASHRSTSTRLDCRGGRTVRV